MIARQTLHIAALFLVLAGAARSNAEPAPLGSNLPISKKEEGVHIPKDCSGASGDFVTAWRRSPGDNAVLARLYSSSGAAEGPEFVADDDISFVSMSGLACKPDRSFIVVWIAFNRDGDDNGIFAQRFDSAGTRLGSAFQSNVTTLGSQSNGDVTIGPDGSFLIGWTNLANGDGDAGGVFARAYDSAGTPFTGEFQVNTFTAGNQALQGIGADGAGVATMIWVSAAQDGSGNGVFGRRLSTTGALIGTEFQINTYTPYGEEDPEVGVAPNGDFVVVWESLQEQDGDGRGIFAQRFTSSGAFSGTEFRVNSYTVHSQEDPVLAVDADGDFVVVWQSNFFVPDHYRDIFAQRYLSTGAADGGEFQVNGPPTDYDDLDYNSTPWVSSDPAGGFVVVWQSSYYQYPSNDHRIMGRRFGLKGPPIACGPAPIGGCISPGKSLLSVKDKAPAGPGGKDKMIWKWLKGPTTPASAFGDPVNLADYALCIYAGTASTKIVDAEIPQNDDCEAGPCWKTAGTKGFSYSDSQADNGGITKINLKGGESGKAKILVKGIEIPTLPLDDTNDIIVQLRNSTNANCWESVFQPAHVIRSNSDKFKAKRP